MKRLACLVFLLFPATLVHAGGSLQAAAWT